MVTIKYDGRLGNNIIQYLSAYVFACKHDLKLITEPKHHYGDFGDFFKFKKPLGERIGKELLIVDDYNFINLLEKPKLELKHYKFEGFFQKKFFLEQYKEDILKVFSLVRENVDKNKVFVHYRIGDIIDDRRMLPFEYYEDALNNLKLKDGYISSENLNHPFCLKLIKEFNLKPFVSDALTTIDFAKNFNNIVLSEGTFSWLIGFLSLGENIYCNERNYKWYGDINMSNWKCLKWDYEEKSIHNSRFLTYYSPIKLI